MNLVYRLIDIQHSSITNQQVSTLVIFPNRNFAKKNHNIAKEYRKI